jgi:hypothetical protein
LAVIGSIAEDLIFEAINIVELPKTILNEKDMKD